MVCTVASVPNSMCLMHSGRGLWSFRRLVEMLEAVAVGASDEVSAEGESAETVSAVALVAVEVNMRSGLHR